MQSVSPCQVCDAIINIWLCRVCCALYMNCFNFRPQWEKATAGKVLFLFDCYRKGFNYNVFIIFFPNRFFRQTVNISHNLNHYYGLNCAHNSQSHIRMYVQLYLCWQCSNPKPANPTLFQFLPLIRALNAWQNDVTL